MKSTIENFQDEGYFKVTYVNPSSEEEFNQINEELTKKQVAFGCPSRLLVDTRQMGTLSLESQRKLAEVYIPKMSEQAGDKIRIALIMGEDVFASFGAKNVAAKTTKESITLPFDSEKDALAWLLK